MDRQQNGKRAPRPRRAPSRSESQADPPRNRASTTRRGRPPKARDRRGMPEVEVVFAASGRGSLEIRLAGGGEIRLGMPESIRLELPEALHLDLLETIREELLETIRKRLLDSVQRQLERDIPGREPRPARASPLPESPPRPESPPLPESPPIVRPGGQELRERLIEVLHNTSGNVSQAARLLSTTRTQIKRWCRRCRIDAAAFRPPQLPPKLVVATSAATLLTAPTWQPSGLGRPPAQPPTFASATSIQEPTVNAASTNGTDGVRSR